jgi:hypothetical protein
MRRTQPLRYLRKPGSANRVGPRETDTAKDQHITSAHIIKRTV